MKSSQALQHFEATMTVRQLAKATRDQYLGFADRFLQFCAGKKFPDAETGITEFLSSLVPCSVANQKGALSALAGKNGFYNSHGRTIGQLPQWVYAQRPVRIPVWTTRSEAEAIISQLPEPWNLMAGLMFGSGLRIGETCELRWRAFDFERGTVSIWSGKGDKCRIAPLSHRLIDPLLARRNNRPGVCPGDQLAKKFPSHGKEWPFFWVFPSAKESQDPASKIIRRHHIHDKSFSKAVRPAVRRSNIDKRITAHSFRHGFATCYLLAGGNLRELQDRLGHDSIETTMGYLHCLPQNFDRIGSPWDIPQTSGAQILPFPKSA